MLRKFILYEYRIWGLSWSDNWICVWSPIGWLSIDKLIFPTLGGENKQLRVWTRSSTEQFEIKYYYIIWSSKFKIQFICKIYETKYQLLILHSKWIFLLYNLILQMGCSRAWSVVEKLVPMLKVLYQKK